jgi:hypothetical protein
MCPSTLHKVKNKKWCHKNQKHLFKYLERCQARLLSNQPPKLCEILSTMNTIMAGVMLI